MAVSGLIPCGGLATDPNPLITGPRGGLRVADDVVIERPGVATQRPGWEVFAASGSISGAQTANVIAPAFDSFVLQESTAGSGFQVRIDAAAPLGAGEFEPLDYTKSFSQFVQARGSVYYSTKNGPYKITSNVSTAADAAGMHEAPSGLPSVVTTGTPVVLPTANAAAWRWCFRKVDANGLITRSPPSPWSTMSNTSGSTVDMSWTIPLPSYVAADDQIELYRSVAVTPATAIPSDVMYLAVSYVVTSTDVSNGYATLTDRTAETALGQELYTNPTREGSLKSNGRPPACMALAQWNECLWFGYVRGPWTAAIDIVTVTGATSTDGLTGLQRLQRTGDSTSGSEVLTNLASTTSIKVGQLVSAGTPGTTPTGFAGPVTVVSKTATTVTLSDVATSSNVGATYYFHDGLKIDGTSYWAGTTEAFGSYPTFTVTTGNRERSTARSLAYVISRVSASVYAFAIEDPYYRDRLGQYTQATVVVRSRALNDGQWAVTFVADTTSSPPAIQFKAAADGTVLVDRDEFPHGVAYSKPAEPEHVPELNFILVGREDEPVYAFAALDTALLVFKRDGVYRITGSPPDGWRVDLIAPNVRILRGECVDVFDGKAFALTSRGVIVADESGVQNVSDGQIGLALRPSIARVLAASTITGAWVRAVPTRNLVIVGVPFTADDFADYQFVLSTTTRAWVRWTRGVHCACWSEQSGVFYAAANTYPGTGAWNLRTLRFPEVSDVFAGHDGTYAPSGWTNTSGSTTLTVTDAQRGDWAPRAGDWVACSIGGTVEYRRVNEASYSSPTWTLTLASAFTAGAQSSLAAYEGIVSKLQWNAFSVGSPAFALLAREIHAAFDWSAYNATPGGNIGGATARLLVGASTNLVNAAATQEWTRDRATLPTVDARATVPTNASRATHLYPYVETCDIGLDWRCDGVTLVYEGASEKGVR